MKKIIILLLVALSLFGTFAFGVTDNYIESIHKENYSQLTFKSVNFVETYENSCYQIGFDTLTLHDNARNIDITFKYYDTLDQLIHYTNSEALYLYDYENDLLYIENAGDVLFDDLDL